MKIIQNKSIITVAILAGGAFDCQPYYIKKDAMMRPDLKCFVCNGAVNHSCVMAFYPKDAKSQSFYFQLN